MLVGVVTVAPGAAVDTRRELRRLLLPGQRRVHTAKESPRRRRALLDVVAALDLNATVFTTRRAPRQSRSDTRRDLIEAACAHVIVGCRGRRVMDSRQPRPRTSRTRPPHHRCAARRRTSPRLRPPTKPRRTAAVGHRRDRLGRRRRPTLVQTRRQNHHRETTCALTRNTRLLTVRRARRVHFPPRQEQAPTSVNHQPPDNNPPARSPTTDRERTHPRDVATNVASSTSTAHRQVRAPRRHPPPSNHANRTAIPLLTSTFDAGRGNPNRDSLARHRSREHPKDTSPTALGAGGREFESPHPDNKSPVQGSFLRLPGRRVTCCLRALCARSNGYCRAIPVHA